MHRYYLDISLKGIMQWVVVAIVAMLGSVMLLAPHSSAAPLGDVCRHGAAQNTAICKNQDENIGGSFGSNLVNTLLFALGIAAVVMIILGGFKYTTANGDASKISSAKNTILYSVVGLVVAIMAWGIVAFVVNQVSR